MKPVDRRKFFAAVQRAGKARGIAFVADPDAGGGSHGSLIFSDGTDTRPLRLVIAYSREISPGVQRAIIAQVRARSEAEGSTQQERVLAKAVLATIEASVAR